MRWPNLLDERGIQVTETMLTALRAILVPPSTETRLRSELLLAIEKHRRAETTLEDSDALLGILVAATRLARHLEENHPEPTRLSTSEAACKCSVQEGTASQ